MVPEVRGLPEAEAHMRLIEILIWLSIVLVIAGILARTYDRIQREESEKRLPAEAAPYPVLDKTDEVYYRDIPLIEGGGYVRVTKVCDSTLEVGIGTFHRRVVYILESPRGVAMQIREPHHTECRE